eukprot:jgi/Ulvmu1/7820/UM004_0049.1
MSASVRRTTGPSSTPIILQNTRFRKSMMRSGCALSLSTGADATAELKRFEPVVELDEQVHKYLQIALGESRLQRILRDMCTPPVLCTIRVNRQNCTPNQVLEELRVDSDVKQHALGAPYAHAVLSNVVCILGQGRKHLDFASPELREVVVTRKAGEAVIRGAHVYAPGVLAMSKGTAKGDLVAVSIARELRGTNKGFGLTRGQHIPANSGPADGPGRDRTALYIGIGQLMQGRREIFKQGSGIAVQLHERVFSIPPFPEQLREKGFAALQNLPSTVTAMVLDAQPGMRVLDMCAAPGGKTCALADCMANSGTIIAFDRTEEKVALVRQMAEQYGHGRCIHAYRKDATGILRLSDEVKARHRADRGAAEEEPPRKKKGAAQMSEREVQRRLRRAAAARQHGHPEPKNNRIPTASAHAARDGAAAASRGGGPGFPDGLERESFDRVLLDAPCSALGLRPRLLVETRLRELEEGARYQRLMLREAAHVLAVGGSLVFSTCTMNPAENEANVRWLLDRYPQLRLVAQAPRLGGPGLVGRAEVPHSGGGARVEVWLTEAEAALVQRFDTTVGVDAIAFFVAKFEKVAQVPEEDALLPVPGVLGAVHV